LKFNIIFVLSYLVKIWDTRKTSQPVRDLKGHHQDVTDVKYSPDGKHLISVSKDGSIKSWNLRGNIYDNNTKSIASEISTGRILTSLTVSNIQKEDLKCSSENIGGMDIAVSAFDGSLSYYRYQKKMKKNSSIGKNKTKNLEVCYSDEFEFSLIHSTPPMCSESDD
jgi:WD40 repeat protein